MQCYYIHAVVREKDRPLVTVPGYSTQHGVVQCVMFTQCFVKKIAHSSHAPYFPKT